MFGLLDLRSSDIKADKRCFYRCNVCNALAKDYGRLSRSLLTNDSVFLSLLISAQRKSTPYSNSTYANRCQPWSKTASSLPDFEYPAAVNMYVSGIRLLDDIHDNGSFRSRVTYALWRSRIRKAEARLRELGLEVPPVEALVKQQHNREIMKSGGYENYSQLTEELYSKIFSHTAMIAGVPHNSHFLAELGSCIGRLAYKLDSYIDLKNDYENGSFNLFNKTLSVSPRSKADAARALIDHEVDRSLRVLGDNVRRIHFERLRTAITHVVTNGIQTMIQDLVSGAKSLSSRPVFFSFASIIPATVALLSGNALAGSSSRDCCGCEDMIRTQVISSIANRVTTSAVEGTAAAAIGAGGSTIIAQAASRIGGSTTQTDRSAEQSYDNQIKRVRDDAPPPVWRPNNFDNMMRSVEEHKAYDSQAEQRRQQKGITREQEHEELLREKPESVKSFETRATLRRRSLAPLTPEMIEKLSSLEKQQYEEWMKKVASWNRREWLNRSHWPDVLDPHRKTTMSSTAASRA